MQVHGVVSRTAVGAPPRQDDGPILVAEMDGVVGRWNGPFTYTRRSTVMGLWSLCASQSACEPTVTAPMASSNTCANADDTGLPEAVGDASLFGSIHATKPIAAKMSFPMTCRGSACVSIGDLRRCPRPQAYTDPLPT